MKVTYKDDTLTITLYEKEETPTEKAKIRRLFELLDEYFKMTRPISHHRPSHKKS